MNLWVPGHNVYPQDIGECPQYPPDPQDIGLRITLRVPGHQGYPQDIEECHQDPQDPVLRGVQGGIKSPAHHVNIVH